MKAADFIERARNLSNELIEQIDPTGINYEIIVREFGQRYTNADDETKRTAHAWLNLCRGCSYCGDMLPVRSGWQTREVKDRIYRRKWVAVCPECGSGFGIYKSHRKGEDEEDYSISNTFESIRELEGVEYSRN